ncbi:MAG: hypothetical protein K2J95_03770 [Lachnospiraceae bacterium]|nr:hypothetical protein [Lachnospiraceae bacterium]
MLAVIVDILKIIGIILLCIIAILLIIILLVLFCPWRYCVDVRREERLTGKAAVSWLLLVLRIEVIYREAVNLRIRVLGIPIYDKLRREAQAAAREEKAAAKEQKKAGKKEKLLPDVTAASVEQKEDALTDKQTSEDETVDNTVSARARQGEEKASEKHTQSKKGRQKTGKVWWEFPQYFFEMLMDWAEKFLEMLLSLPELVEGPVERPVERLEKKITSVVGRVEYYTKLLQKKGSKWVIDFLKVRIFKVLKHIRPRNARINLYYAADDPAKVADMMAYYGMALPWLPRHTNFTAELGEPKLEGSIRIKGRVCLIVLLWHGLGIYLNKKVKTFLKLLKEGQKM